MKKNNDNSNTNNTKDQKLRSNEDFTFTNNMLR